MDYEQIFRNVAEALRGFYWFTAILINLVILVIVVLLTFYII